MSRPASRFVRALVLLLLCAVGTPTSAQEPQRYPAAVYGINAALPTGYAGTFAPPSVRNLYLLADQISVISLRNTEIYFWPISNEYRANWEVRNDLVPGTLEVLQDGQVIAEIKPTDYTIHVTPQGINTGSSEIYVGAAAVEANQRFEAKRAAYKQASADYYAAQQAWMAAMQEVRSKREAGVSVPIPPEPQPPEAIGVFSNGLNQGYPLKLAAGAYRIRVRDSSGEVVPESERTLSIIAPRRTAVGYTVVPETRWTTPEQVDDVSDAIIGKPQTNLYLEPHVIYEFPALAYERLQNPQFSGREAADWKWVPGQTLKTALLEVISRARPVERHPLTQYQVKQLSGEGLGYEVLKFDPNAADGSTTIDFEAYPIRLEQAASTYRVQLVTPEGQVVPGSARLVRVPVSVPFVQLAGLASVPLLVGAIMIARRRRRLKLPRNVAK